MSYDALREVEPTTVDALVSQFGLDDKITGEESPGDVQAELLEAINQFGSQTMDDTVKRNGMWALIRALGIIEQQNNLDTSFDVTAVDGMHPDLITTTVDEEPLQSVLSQRS